MRLVAALALAVLLATPLAAAAQSPQPAATAAPGPAAAQYSSRRVVVKLRAPLDAKGPPLGSALASVNAQLGARLTPLFSPPPRRPADLARYLALGMDRLYIAESAADMNPTAAVASYLAAGEVEDAEADPIGSGGDEPPPPPVAPSTPLGLPWLNAALNKLSFVPNDPGYSQQWHLPKINAPAAWDISTGDGSAIIAIVDTGIAGWHPDLRGQVWYNPLEIPGNGVDDDGNGYVDDNWGWDFVNNDNNPEGDHWHGTHVAGIVGAEANNGLGITGLDPRARLMAVKVLDSQNLGNYTTWAQGVYYAAQNGARVINMSLGGSIDGHLALRTAVDYAYGKGIVLVVCMMNTNSNVPYYPAAYPNTIAVGATDRNDYRASPFSWGGGSNWGAWIDVVAPGNLIYSTGLNSTYFAESGTSMATPQVSALAALILSLLPNAGPEDVRQILRQTADDGVGRPGEDTPGWDVYMGAGRINAARALSLARARSQATPTPTATARATATPTATPTATDEPGTGQTTPTPTVTTVPLTATPTQTPAPTATLAAGCVDALANGGFDGRDGWTLSGRRALISGTGRTGFGLFLGLLAGDSVENASGDWASARQDVTAPDTGATLTLTFCAYTAHTGGADANDRFLARVLNAAGQTLVDVPLAVDSATWQAYHIDITRPLAAYAGQAVTVYFGVRNVSGTGGNAFMRVDDARLTVCGESSLTLTPTPRPTATLYPDGPHKVYLPGLSVGGDRP